MSAITALRPSRRSAGWIAVAVDGRFVASLPSRMAAEVGLDVGVTWTDELAGQVAAAAAFARCLREGLRRVDRRAMTCQRLALKLGQKGHESAVVQRVIDRMVELGALDDVAYAREYVRQVQAGKPAGDRLLRARLQQRGVPRPIAEQVIRETESQRDPLSAATELLRRKLPALSRLDPTVRRRRLWGLLARRGFDPQVCREAFEALRLDGDDSEL